MAKMTLGKVGITLGGVYDATQTYDKLVCVTHDGRSWVSRTAVPAGAVPSETTHRFWQLVSERGEQGEQGPQGPQGVSGPRGLQGNSGYTGAADELEVVNNLETSNARAALSAKMGMELGIEVTRLSQEFENIVNADFTLNPNIEKVVLSDSEVTLEPGKYYTWDKPMAYLDIALIPPTMENYVGKYVFTFTCPQNAPTYVSLPIGMKWSGVPDFKADNTYVIFIIDQLAIFFADPKVESGFVTTDEVQAMIDGAIVTALNTEV